MKSASTLFLLILSATILYGQTSYYVSPKGNDQYTGSMKKPFRTTEKLNTVVFKPGDKIFFEANVVHAGSLILNEQDTSTPEKPITIGSYGKGRATLQVSTGNGILVNNLSGIIIQDLIVTSIGLAQNDGYGVKVFNNKPGLSILKMVRIKNVEASNFKWAGIFVGGVPTDLPNVKVTEGSRFGFKDVEITNCMAHHNMYYGIYMTAMWNSKSEDYGNEDVTIRQCISHDNGGDPTYTANHSGSGIMVDDTKNVLIEYCTSYHNGAVNAGLTGGPCGIWSHSSTNVLIQHCEAYNNKTNGAADGGGFDLDGGVTNSVIQYCYSHDNDGPGYLMWNYEDAPHALSDNTLRYNISANDCRKHSYGAIHIGTSGLPITNIKIHNNTIYVPLTTEGNAKAIWTGGSASNESLHFYNNLFITDGKAPLVEIDPGQKNIVFAGNAYWCSGMDFILNYEKQAFSSLAEWQKATGQEKVVDKTSGLFTDPKITMANEQQTINDADKLSTLKNFMTLSGSPLIGAGVDLGKFSIQKVNKDFWGNTIPVDAAPSIGAYYFSGK